MKKPLALGIDTSNYKTSIAVTDSRGNILVDERKFLKVKEGERGLRQSEAFFQHINVLPELLESVLKDENLRKNIGVVAVSTKPRPIENSYMPVFLAGSQMAKIISESLAVSYYEFSHQEGHLEAVKFYSKFKKEEKLISFHFSGGTTEAILDDNKSFSIIGGSKDISYGQVLDRLGVALGMKFPAGAEMDEIAMRNVMSIKKGLPEQILSKIKVQDGWVNLSGIETQCQRALSNIDKDSLITMVFYRIGESILSIMKNLAQNHQIKKFIFAGGVSDSKFIREYLKNNISDNFDYCFSEGNLSSDNGIGISLLGGKEIWH